MFFKFTVLLVCVYIGCGSAYPNDNANTEKSSIATRHRRSPNLGNNSQCGGFPLKNRVRSSCPTPTTCYTECEQGFQFPNNESKVELICDAGEWQLKGLGTFGTIDCEPLCHCQNGGTCTAPNFCTCPKNYGGEQCELLTCDTVPNILNSYPNCTLTNCNITCNDRYSFADGSTVVQINCEKGKFNLAPNQPHQTIPSACQPICKTPCQHNGVCSQPEKCSCPSHYEGDHCELEKVPVVKCPDKPVVKNGRLNCDSTNECKVNCFNGFELPDGTIVMAITCQQGQWKAKYSKQNFDPFCTRKCSPPCQNGGECLKNNTCICPKDYEGNQCKFKKGCKTNPITQNANIECNVDNCKITCDKGHVLPDHSTEMHMKCEKLADVSDGITEFGWMPVNSKQNFDPICNPVCSQPCQNGGVCTKPNTCTCPPRFEGKLCQDEMGCKTSPTTKNANANCTLDDCKVTCDSGYALPDKSTGMELKCKHQKWEPANPKQSFDPICEPVCSQPCQNGGVCTKPNTCTCPPRFEGKLCQDEMGCKTSPTTKNANANCTLDDCKVTCDSGYALPDKSTGMELKCKHQKWEPANPKQSFDPICEPVCSQPCQNGGVCTKPNTCTCSPRFEGKLCQDEMGCKTSPTTKNANANCTLDDCKVTCDSGYALPDKSTGMELKCKHQKWEPANSKQSFDPICEPVCSQPCENGGGCTKPNTCSCPNGFDGPQCGRKVCVPQPAVQDAHSSCDQFNCKITCNQGYVFPDGSDVMQMDCKNGKWESASLKQNSAPDCQLKCNTGFVYNKCGPNVEQTCDNAEEKSVCVPGCFCPNGMVKHEGKCIQSDNCPCRSNGAIFQPGSETVSTDDALSVATTCKCERATMQCKSEPFTRMRCSVTGDPHIRSFDDITYDIQGKGSFRLVNTSNTVIEAQFVPCGGPYSCTKSITIKVNHGDRNATVVLKQNLKVEVNGQPVEIFPMQVLSDYMLISLPSSTKVSVVSKEGWRIFWDGRINVDIDTISLYKGKINGLCEVKKNKRRKRSTEVDMKAWLATIAQKSCIGNSCNSIDEFVPNIPNPCDSNVEAMERAERLCSKLKDDPFKACHGTVNPQTHYDNCMFDMCACERGIDSCMCDIFTAYANECSRRGNVVKYWRQSIQECAIKCPTGQIYEECSKSCYRSCDDLQLSPKNCTRDCVDGCRCPEGQALDRNNKCIPIDMCHSFDYEPRHDQIGANQTCAWTGLGWKCVNEPNSTNSNTAQTQESCMPVSLNATQTVDIVQLTGSKYGKCVNTEPIQGYTVCRGTCGPVNSNTGLTSRQFHEEKCCSMIKYEKVRVPLLCESGKKFISSVYMPRECSCSNCNQRYPLLH